MSSSFDSNSSMSSFEGVSNEDSSKEESEYEMNKGEKRKMGLITALVVGGGFVLCLICVVLVSVIFYIHSRNGDVIGVPHGQKKVIFNHIKYSQDKKIEHADSHYLIVSENDNEYTEDFKIISKTSKDLFFITENEVSLTCSYMCCCFNGSTCDIEYDYRRGLGWSRGPKPMPSYFKGTYKLVGVFIVGIPAFISGEMMRRKINFDCEYKCRYEWKKAKKGEATYYDCDFEGNYTSVLWTE